jgi:hypothetical protein
MNKSLSEDSEMGNSTVAFLTWRPICKNKLSESAAAWVAGMEADD